MQSANALGGRELAAAYSNPKTTEGASKSAANPHSYAKAATKNVRPWTRLIIRELEAPIKKRTRKVVLGLMTLQWKLQKLINKGLIHPGQPLKKGTLKNKVETMMFIYVEG